MNAPASPQEAASDPSAYAHMLQTVTNKIHAAANVDEIMLEVSQEICDLFRAQRLTIYVVSEDRNAIVSRVKTGLASFKDLRLPINEQSIAGCVAIRKQMLNLKDVYDDQELHQYNPRLHFLREVDRRTGFRTKQMLVAPIVDARNGELLGVVQLINTQSGQPFAREQEEGVVSICETLAIALRQRQRAPQQVRGKYDALVADAVISAQEMELATRSARRKGIDIEDVLVEEFQVKRAVIGAALGSFFGVNYESFRPDRIKPVDLLRNLKREFVETNGWVPLEDGKEGLVVMTTDPERLRASRMVGNVFPKARVVYTVTTQHEFTATLDQFYGGGTLVDDMSGDVGDFLDKLDEDTELETGGGDDATLAQDNELVKLVNKIIVDAYQQGASDIHIEPFPGKGKTEVRFRRDGTLMHYVSVPASYRNALVARLKIMCDLDIAERRKPQDGKIKFRKFGPLDIELRVATVPSQGGVEDIVMRILAGGEPMPMDSIGLSERNLATVKDLMAKPYGLFFVCGPTGSGKTTTLHSILGHINTPETKIWTVEDPVEITQKGLRQVQMNPKAGITFATAMRAFLRADPDVIMVGEMRDKETTSIGIEASLTGHLVLSTLHTNSAAESVTRLLDMGMDPFNFADALLGVLAQRLAKRLCPKCKKPHVADDAEIESLLSEFAAELEGTDVWQRDPADSRAVLRAEWVRRFGNDKGELILYAPVGCEVCGGTGYKGRVGLHELLVGSDTVKRLIQERARVAQILATGLAEGMRTLRQDGVEKVLQGITDMKQVRAVCIR